MVIMILLIISLAAIFTVLVVTEYIWRKKIVSPETARKTVHIIVGVIVASWMFYLSQLAIVLLGIAMFTVVGISKRFAIFHAIHSVKRKTFGELYFAIGIVLAALLTNSPWIFAAAILHVSLADGLAGLVGSASKKPLGYWVFKHFKSVQGTATFFIVSVVIFMAAIYFDPLEIPNIALPIVAVFSLLIALIENVSPYGSDDLIVPVAVIAILESVSLLS